jgi:hypothetical protein
MSRTGWSSSEKIDWSQVSDKGPAPLDEGLYLAKLAKAEPQLSKKTNKPMIKLTVEVSATGDGEKLPKPRTIFDYCVLTQEAAFRVGNLTKALGLASLEDTGFETVSTLCKDAVGAAKSGVYVRIKHETRTDNNGEERIDMRIAKYLSEEQVKEAAEKSSDSDSDDSDSPPRRRARSNNAVAEA